MRVGYTQGKAPRVSCALNRVTSVHSTACYARGLTASSAVAVVAVRPVAEPVFEVGAHDAAKETRRVEHLAPTSLCYNGTQKQAFPTIEIADSAVACILVT